MKAISSFVFGLIVVWSIQTLKAEEIIKDKSPDGKFALRLIHGEEGWETSIVELPSKKKIIDLEVVTTSGDHERRAWVASVDTFRIEDYAKDAKLVWSDDSQRVAYFNEDRDEHTMNVYFRHGDTFEEAPLPEIPRCDEIKDENPKDLRTVWYKLTPESWVESGSLLATFSGEWQTLNKKMIGCEQTITIAFDAQRRASLAKTEKPREAVGQKIESPNGTFFVEELNAPAKDDEGHPRMDQEVWIVSAKDPAMRERLPGFYEEEGSGVLNGATISPDEKWIVISQHHGSHLNSTYLMHRKEGLKFQDAFPNAKWPLQEEPVNRFDNEVWKFFSKIENVPIKKIDANELGPPNVSALEWSEDSTRLLLALAGGLTGDNDIADRGRYEKPGVSGWFVYFNAKAQKFELTDRLRKINKGARKRWSEQTDSLPPSAESIGHEGPDAPVAERLKKYEAELAAMVKRRAGQLDGADRAEFEKKEADWRDKLEEDAAQIKDPAKQLGMRARSTWYHLIDVREERLPVYEEAKSGDAKQSQP